MRKGKMDKARDILSHRKCGNDEDFVRHCGVSRIKEVILV